METPALRQESPRHRYLMKEDNIMNRRDFIKKTIIGCAVLSTGIISFPSIIHAKTVFNVGYIPILDHVTLMVSHANDNHRFKKIDVIPKLFKSWSSVAGALRAKKIDAAFLLSPLAMDMFSKEAGIRSVLIGHRNGSGIIVGKNKKISSPQDMREKRIAIPAEISTHTALLDKYLREGGLTLNDVRTKIIAPPNMIKALQADYIDAFIVAEPFCAKAENMGIGNTLILSKKILPNHICCIVVVRNEALSRNPEGIREWVSSLKQSGKLIDEDKANNKPGNIAEIIARYTPHKVRDIISGMTNPDDRIVYSDLDPRLPDYQAIYNISRQAGILSNIDMNQFIDNRFSEKVS